MQCPNPDCEDPGQASILLLSGENITCCPKCGEVLSLHEDRFDFQEEENEGSQGKKNEHLKVSIQENSKDTGETATQILLTEGHQPEGSRQTEKEVTILGSECVFGTAPSRNPDMFHPEEATRDAKTFYGRGKKRSSPMHQSDMDDRVPEGVKRMKNKNESSDDNAGFLKRLDDAERRVSKEIEGTCELEQPMLEEAQPEQRKEFNDDHTSVSEEKIMEGYLSQALVDIQSDEDQVTIVFHALLSPSFHFNSKEHRVFLRAGDERLVSLSWDYNLVEIFPVRLTKEKFFELCGHLQLPISFLWSRVPYKYVVCTSEGTLIEWEYSEFHDDSSESITNRMIDLPEDKFKKGVWHQYDGVIYPKPREGAFQWFWNYWSRGSAWTASRKAAIKDREHAVCTFLPKWKGFVDGNECDTMTATEALDQTLAVFHCHSRVNVCIGSRVMNDFVQGFNFSKVLVNFLGPKIHSNANMKKGKLTSHVRVERLVSSLTITSLIEKFDLRLPAVQLRGIIRCLVVGTNDTTAGQGCDFDEIHKHFPEEMWGSLAQAILHLLNAAKIADTIVAVPLLHFLRKDSKPFEELEATQEPRTIKYWCCSNGLQQFKPEKFVESFLPQVLPMFSLDPLLRRFFLCCTPFEEFKDISSNDIFPVHEICHALSLKLREGKYLAKSTVKLSSFATSMNELIQRLERCASNNQREPDQNSIFCAKSTCFLLEEFQKKFGIKEESFLEVLNLAVFALNSVDKLDQETREHKAMFDAIWNVVRTGIEKELSWFSPNKEYQKKQLKIWNQLLKVSFSKEELSRTWRANVVSLFERNTKKLSNKDTIDLFCEVDANQLHGDLMDSVKTQAFVVAKRIAEKTKEEEKCINSLQVKCFKEKSSRAGQLLSLVLTHSWSKAMAKTSKDVEDQTILHYILITWKPWQGFLKLYAKVKTSSDHENIITDEASVLINQVITQLITIQYALEEGTVEVKRLVLLKKFKEPFLSLCTTLKGIEKGIESTREVLAETSVKKSLIKRIEELQSFETLREEILEFINICTASKEYASFDFNTLEEKANFDISDTALVDLCRRLPQDGEIDVVFFGKLSTSFRSMLTELVVASKSVIFHAFWSKYCKIAYRGKKGGFTLEEVQNNIWKPAIDKLEHLAKEAKDGSVNLKSIDKNFKKIKDLEKELKIIFEVIDVDKTTLDQTVVERVSQIQLYNSLQSGMQAVETVWQFKESLHLTGDFRIIDELHDQTSKEFKEKRLDSIDTNFSHANDFLQVISLENAKCLRAIIDCQPLVIWLREEIKDTSALSTLVDLAMISAGENDVEVDRISNFHTSCINFASLIFDFDVEIGFTELMTACESVWNALKDDKQLPTKLYDTNRHLEWLKAVEKSHGSVEMSSLMQTKAINSSGVYRVGNMTIENTTRSIFMSSEKMTLEHVMTLTVPIDQAPVDPRGHDDETEMRDLTKTKELKKYSLNDLKDLQSKLMLIAGKTAKLQNKDCIESTEEINKFVEILEGIMRVGQLYIDLCEAGDDQYLRWSKEVKCSENQEPHGSRSVYKEIVETTLAMENRLKTWQDDVHSKRREYKELNHFTAKQILVLRRELGLLRHASSVDVPLQVYTLLESVNVDITNEELITTLKEILRIKIDAAGNEVEESDVEVDQSDDDDDDDEMEEDTDRIYLTLDVLGSILFNLAATCKKPKSRRFPEYLKVDHPNLVLVDQGEIFPTVLSLYMKYGENTVPTPSEVLVCSPDTTEEEVELFWWRAFGDLSEQIYCLVSPDLLDYNVSQAALNAFSTLRKEFAGTTLGYRILVLCSTQNEDRSHIIAAFDSYRINAPISAPAEVLSDYLRRQFTCTEPLTGYVDEEEVPWIHACSLDPDKLGIRVVSSNRAGVGKSLLVSRLSEKLLELENNRKVKETKEHEQVKLAITVPLHRAVVNTCAILDALWQNPVKANLPVSRIIHLDVSPSVTEGLEYILFNLLVLGVLSDSNGRLWRRRATDLYVVEMTKLIKKPSNTPPLKTHMSASFISLLPTTTCVTPKETLEHLNIPKDPAMSLAVPLFDEQEYRSVPVNRVFQYLQKYNARQDLNRYRFTDNDAMGSPAECLRLIINFCGMRDPSWSELKHFVDFLSSQLQDCEESAFCNAELMDDGWMEGTLLGFKSFVVHFMVTMSRDFATPSLENNVTFTPESAEHDNGEDIRPLELRRRWESSCHPYIFFNKEGETMTFLGFHVDNNGDLIDPDTRESIERGLMTTNLRRGISHQGVELAENYANWNKEKKIRKLCSVLGVQERADPDPSYELTIDNMKKILAIHMRFRCGIPVVIMGETGCGKTCLIRYMCALQAGINDQRNMLVMKVHGGTSFEDICKKVKQAEEVARKNEEEHQIDTVLFFDEANTTEALPMIKEVMVDRRINGQPVGEGLQRLHFIAACNPYRRHSKRMIEKLESAGLGYSVKADETKERLGKIPLRHLVYRVHSLPESIRPLVWDFGQLRPETEDLYISQIVSKYVLIDKTIPGNEALVKAISPVLSAAQRYMREQQDECSFVSLRDVERAMTVMSWFYKHRLVLRPQTTSSEKSESDDEKSEDEDEKETQKEEGMDMVTWSLLLSLGVCYHAKLRQRSAFRRSVVSACELPLKNDINEKQMNTEILRCQKVLIEELNLGPNIARNTALSENVFMMVVCIELRIPLFVIGKPGSSKSLAKTVVAHNMQGDASKSQLFKTFKLAHMVSYQCSPLSTPEGIVATFRQCRRLQDKNPVDRYASVVVLDEVGLAEDSPLMPLKTLHPLLEDGVTSSDDVIEADEKPTRVAFIGISNWALDPAKMNRGLMLVRAEPSKKELEDSARGICAEREEVQAILSSLLKKLAAGYSDLYREQKNFESLRQFRRDEFFGLRDFYSLVKMVYSIAAQKGRKPNWKELEHAIRRNFGGLDEINAVEIFKKRVTCGSDEKMQEPEAVNTLDLLTASLDRRNTIGESRYLLVLTENYSALRIVEQQLNKNNEDYVVIFGSSFPKDQEYTQICRNINQIKVCMETGRTVVLLNLEKLYESLYDVLNQYYVKYAEQKYVDLGLGSHRVKCRVDNDFRLIVVAEKDVVYDKFPIPLINRLEKHYLVTSKSLDQAQLDMVKDLRDWARNFASAEVPLHKGKRHFEIGDAFVGYHDDTIPSMVLQVCSDLGYDGNLNEENVSKIMEKCKDLLIQCATPDAIMRLANTSIKDRVQYIQDVYFKKQEHTSLVKYLERVLRRNDSSSSHLGLLAQVSTHSRMLSENDMTDICKATGIECCYAKLLTLQQFQTEQQFMKQVRDFLQTLTMNEGLLVVQCDSSDENFNLLSCTRHLLMDQRLKRTDMLTENQMGENVPPVNLMIIAQLPRVKGGCKNFVGFQGGTWESVHIDDLCPATNQIPPIECLLGQSISDLLKPEVNCQDIEMEEVVAEEKSEREDAREENKREDTMEVDDEETPAITLNESNANLLRSDTEAMETNDTVLGQVSEEDVQPEHGRLHEVHTRQRKDADQKSYSNFDVMVLLRKSIQSAAGRLRDHPSMLDRTTERINILLKLLPENYANLPAERSFARILHSKIYKLLEEKNKCIGFRAFDWVRREALEEISVHEYGTFVKALHHRMLSEIEPLLAKVLVCVDGDCNLDLLREGENSQWISRLWNFIFDNDRLCKIHYDPSRSGTTHEPVPVSGRGRHSFRCRFPFSWLIKSLIDDLMRGASDVSSHSREQKLRNILESSELSQIFKIIKQEGKEEEAVMRYLHDFVHIVYEPTSESPEEEIQLVCNSILMDFQKRNEEKAALDFAAIHITYNLIQARINNFNQLVKAEPRLPTLLSRNQHPLGVDVASLLGCLETLEPSSQDLDTYEHRNQWCGRVLNVRKTIETMTSKDVFSKTYVETERYEEEEKELLKQIWLMWQRLNVVRLFIDDVCNACRQLNTDIITQYVDKLWKVLGEDPNFLKASYVHRLERFLLDCSQDLSRRNKCSDTMTCPICRREFGIPSVAPCGHCSCLECATRWSNNHSTCSECRTQFPADYVPSESKPMRKAIENVKEFRNHCNSFFMEVVSLFCFGHLPCGSLEHDTFCLLMSFATGHKGSNTKSFSPFPDHGVDSTPVVRSFLLQQLLRSSDIQVKKYMDDFITKARSFAKVEDVEHAVEVFVMCVQCMEDSFNGRFAKETCDLSLDQKLRIIIKDCKKAFTLFYGRKDQQTLSINWLEGIARSRVVLSLAAELMYQRQTEQDEQKWSHPEVKSLFCKLLVEVRKMCVQDDPSTTSTPKLFLLKQLSRKYGFESINNLAQNSDFDWILPSEAGASVKVSQDRFLVFGDPYQELREMISRSLVSRDMSQVEDMLKGMKGTVESKSAALLLGIFQEITEDRRVSPMARQNLETFLRDSAYLNNKARQLAMELISETHSKSSIKSMYVLAGKTPWDTSVLEIVIHLAALLFSRENNDLLGPLVSLALRPDTMNDSFLPTMPEDPLEYVRASIAGAFYECENGHPYLVTECGRPTESSKCRVPGCEKTIGGVNHQLTSGNRAARTNDLTSKGHVLGPSDRRERAATPERGMTALGTCLLRLLVHGSMLIGSCYRPQYISQLILPLAVRPESLQEFLWKHAIHDMHLLSMASERSVDDTALIVHLVLQKASEYPQSHEGRYLVLPTKEKRKEWEMFFSTNVIQPVMPNLESRIRSTMELIVNDVRFGSNPLLCQLYELESVVEDYTNGIQPNCVALWRFRTPVTIGHVTRTFSESDEELKKSCVVLQEFLKKEKELRAVKYLPDVVKLQRFLLDHFRRTLDKTELVTLKLRDFYKRLTKGDSKELKPLVQSFLSALALKALSEKGASVASIGSVNEESPLSIFIPVNSAAGNPSLDLVRFLVDTQNEFLKFCSQQLDNVTLTGISLLDITNSELVSYDTDHDLIPLVLAHCRYSIQAGHGTLVEYNWPALQKQIVDRLIRGRMVIDFEEKNFKQAVQDTVETVLTNLKSKIPQVELSIAIKNQIIQQYRSLEDICEALSSLNIAITFLASGGGNPNMPISEYIHHVLIIPEESDLHNIKAREVCQLQHSVSLWRLLTIQRAKILTSRGQDPFEQLSSEFKARLEDESVKLAWRDSLEKLSKDSLDSLVSILLDFIVLHLKDAMDIEQLSLKEYINWYMEEKELQPVADLDCIPSKALVKHIVEMWEIAIT